MSHDAVTVGEEQLVSCAAGDATRWAKKKAAAATALEEAAAKQRQSRQEQRELYAQLTRKTHETHGAAWCAAEARKLKDSYFPGVSALFLCARLHLLLLPHLPRDFVALLSCPQIPQLLTLADVRFLRKA